MKNATELHYNAYQEQDDHGPTGHQIWEFDLVSEGFRVGFSGVIDEYGITCDFVQHNQPSDGEFAKQRKEVLFAILETQQNGSFRWARLFKYEICEVQALTNYIMNATNLKNLISKIQNLVEKEVEWLYT